MTVGELMNAISGYNQRLKRETENQDQLNYILGKYIATGVNAPNKYPKSPLLSKNQPKQMYSPEQFRKIMKQRYGKKK